MVDTSDGAVASVLARLTGAVDALLELQLCRLTDDELLELARGLERQRRRLPAADHSVIGELNRRGTAAQFSARDTAALLIGLLRLDPGEATARVRAATDLGARVTLGGEPQPPLFATVACAQRSGAVSPAAARVITATVPALPDAVQDVHGAAVERALTDQALSLDPRKLCTVARRVRDILDPDGILATDADHARRRDLTLHPNRDGSADVSGHLDPACAAVWQTVLDALSRPTPAEDGARDPRTPGQRRHDGLHDAGLRLLRSADLPESGGCPVTVLVTVDHRDLRAEDKPSDPPHSGGPERCGAGGLARTAHGGLMSHATLLPLIDEARLVAIALNAHGAITAAGEQVHAASPAQRRALAARDGGCSFPGCTVPPAWCQAHHVVPWHRGGPTALANLTLLCGHHHRSFESAGWTCHMRDGVPWWRPPRWIDPDQRLRRNDAHHPPLNLPIPRPGNGPTADDPTDPIDRRDPNDSSAASAQRWPVLTVSRCVTRTRDPVPR